MKKKRIKNWQTKKKEKGKGKKAIRKSERKESNHRKKTRKLQTEEIRRWIQLWKKT